jgi:tRNA (cmo5U34)-methyltransferase
MTQENPLDFDRNKSLPVNNYDAKIRHLVPGYEVIFNVILALLHQKLPQQANLLIVGAGGGNELSVFGHGSQWQLTGIDPSAEMLNAATRKVEALGLSERVRLIQGTLEDVPLTTLFNAATSVLVMHFLPDDGSKLSFLKSIHQLLESGSPLFLVDFGGEKGSEQFEQILSAWKFHAVHTGAPLEFIEEQLEKVIPNFMVIPEERVIELLREAGFTEIVLFYKVLMFSGWVAIKA